MEQVGGVAFVLYLMMIRLPYYRYSKELLVCGNTSDAKKQEVIFL
jgi:hypothetical protein